MAGAGRDACCVGEVCYCPDNGRPGVEPVLLMGVLVLQFLERLPDRQALEMVKYHLGWKLALNLELEEKGFHPTVLVYFRQRLLECPLRRFCKPCKKKVSSLSRRGSAWIRPISLGWWLI